MGKMGPYQQKQPNHPTHKVYTMLPNLVLTVQTTAAVAVLFGHLRGNLDQLEAAVRLHTRGHPPGAFGAYWFAAAVY